MTAASVAANLGGVALVALPGLGFAELLAPLRRLSVSRRLGYAYLLGALAIGGVLFATSHLFGAPLRRPAIGLAVLVPTVLGLAAWIWRRRGGGAAKPALPTSRWQLLAGLTIGAVLLGPLTSALTAPLADWDGRMTWSAIAAYMRHEGTVDASVLRDAHWYVMTPRYPPLLPLVQVAVQETLGAAEDEQDYRAVYAGFWVALVLIVHDAARRGAGSRAAAVATLCASLPPLLSYGGGGATSCNSDLALAGFYGAALVLLLFERPRLASGFAAGCLLAGGVLTKNEGSLLAMAALLLAAERLWHRRRDPTAGPRALAWFGAAAAPVLAAVALLASWRAAIPNRDDPDYFTGLRLTDLVKGAFTRLPVIVPEVLRWTFRGSDWLGFWWLFLAVLLAGIYALRRLRVRRLLLAGLTPAAIAWAAYAVSTRLPDLIGETWDRLLVQGLVPLAFVFACALERLMRPGHLSRTAPTQKSAAPPPPGATLRC